MASYSANSIGTVTTLTNGAQAVSTSYEYEAFGSLRASSGGVANPYRFTGRELDANAGLLYYRARWYDPMIGRFLVADPWRFVDGPNFYAYVRANPVAQVDPRGLGLDPCRTGCINGGGGGGGGSGFGSDCSHFKGDCFWYYWCNSMNNCFFTNIGATYNECYACAILSACHIRAPTCRSGANECAAKPPKSACPMCAPWVINFRPAFCDAP